MLHFPIRYVDPLRFGVACAGGDNDTVVEVSTFQIGFLDGCAIFELQCY